MKFCFQPPYWARNRHLQTIWPALFRHPRNLPPDEKWRVPLDSNVELFGKYWPGFKEGVIALLYHGLGGHSDSPYLVGAARALHREGFHVLRMELRGAELEGPATPAIYHSGLVEDIDPLIRFINQKGFNHIYLVGFSLSGNLLLKWLAAKKRPIERAFVVSPPVRLTTCADLVDSPANRIYRNYFLRKLRRSIRRKARDFPESFERYNRIENYLSIRGFDDAITAKFFGFNGAEDYYKKSSAAEVLRNIQNEVAIIHSEDDPFLDSSDLRELRQNCPKNISLHIFPRGGHVGFYEGLRRGYAVDRWLVEYFCA